MDLHMAMAPNQEEELMRIIAQFDGALTTLPYPFTSPRLLPSNPCRDATPSPVRWTPVPPPAAVAGTDLATAREALCRAAWTGLQPVPVGTDAVEPMRPRPRRRSARVSSAPRSVAARLRRERVSQRMRALQRLVPGGAGLDTASMLEEAVRYVKFLKSHVRSLLEQAAAAAVHGHGCGGVGDDDDDDGASYPCPYLA